MPQGVQKKPKNCYVLFEWAPLESKINKWKTNQVDLLSDYLLLGRRHIGAVVKGPKFANSARDCYNLCLPNILCGYWNYFPTTKTCYQVKKINKITWVI
jgi:hypothetical protein